MLILPKFEYLEPLSIREACTLLSKYGAEARVMAGGTDLLVKMKIKALSPKYVINLKRIEGLSYIQEEAAGGLRIGALTVIHDLIESRIIYDRFKVLGEALETMGSAQTRNMGTIGGNLCNASPVASTATPLMALGGKVKVMGLQGERRLSLEEFLVGPGKTALGAGEIVTEISIPAPRPHSGGSYQKLSLRKDELSVVSVTVMLSLGSESKVCQQARVTLGAVAPTVIRSSQAEKVLEGKVINETVIRETALAAGKEARPISDLRSGAEYRREMVEVLTKRAVKQALKSVN